jgi:acetyl-CoA acetyltransferase
MHGKPLDAEKYDASRWIAEPLHLFDCCMENDGAAAIVMVDAERAADFAHKPVYLLGAASGSAIASPARPQFAVLCLGELRNGGRGSLPDGRPRPRRRRRGPELRELHRGRVMALAEHRFFSPQEANDFLTWTT